MHDDGYQGIPQDAPLTDQEAEIAGLLDQITRLDEQAQAAEDRDNVRRASELRAKIRPLRAKLDALTGKGK